MKDATASRSARELPARTGVAPASLAAAHSDAALDVPASLPRDHPAWQRDVLAVSARVRALLASLRPVTVRVLTFWDHVVRGIVIGGHRIEIDPSGSYRLH